MNKSSLKKRCHWVDGADALMQEYHDSEWGIPVHNDQKHFEMLVLEFFQSGLSWQTILRKRENFRKAFSNFDVKKVARYGAKERERLLNDTGIVRNKRKIDATMHNAIQFMLIQKEYGSFDAYIWSFVGGKTKNNKRKKGEKPHAQTDESRALARSLKEKYGFKHIGPITCYSHMQAAGLVNDHEVGCSFARPSR